MSESKQATYRGGIGLPSALFLVFLVLKLTHVVDWSWWWVTAPLWVGFLTFFAALVLVTVGAVVIVALREKRETR